MSFPKSRKRPDAIVVWTRSTDNWCPSVFAVPGRKYGKTFLLEPTRCLTIRSRKTGPNRTGNSNDILGMLMPKWQRQGWLSEVSATSTFPVFTAKIANSFISDALSRHARTLSGTRDDCGRGPPNVARRGPTSSISPDGDLHVTCSRGPRGVSTVVALSTARCRAMHLSSLFAASRRHLASPF